MVDFILFSFVVFIFCAGFYAGKTFKTSSAWIAACGAWIAKQWAKLFRAES